ncbi:MAG: proline--tRNA ligase, partial [Bacteroidales bacterium]
YADFAENYMAIPVIKGYKSANERFAGAIETLSIEALMQDGKALQCGTSHFLGQNFAKAFDVKFQNRQGVQEYVWATSWGVSTRLIGALIMAHSDDNGLVLPPRLAPLQVIIVPIYKNEQEQQQVAEKAQKIMQMLQQHNISVKFDGRDTQKPGWKFAEYELKGVPIRIAVGPKDVAENTVEIARRDTLEKQTYPDEKILDIVQFLLTDIQNNLYKRALQFREEHTTEVNTFEEFKEVLETKGGFVSAHWDGTPETEEKIKEETKATIRCIPFDQKREAGKCVYSGKPSQGRVLFARAY